MDSQINFIKYLKNTYPCQTINSYIPILLFIIPVFYMIPIYFYIEAMLPPSF